MKQTKKYLPAATSKEQLLEQVQKLQEQISKMDEKKRPPVPKEVLKELKDRWEEIKLLRKEKFIIKYETVYQFEPYFYSDEKKLLLTVNIQEQPYDNLYDGNNINYNDKALPLEIKNVLSVYNDKYKELILLAKNTVKKYNIDYFEIDELLDN